MPILLVCGCGGWRDVDISMDVLFFWIYEFLYTTTTVHCLKKENNYKCVFETQKKHVLVS
jgi:hypothetical protein